MRVHIHGNRPLVRAACIAWAALGVMACIDHRGEGGGDGGAGGDGAEGGLPGGAAGVSGAGAGTGGVGGYAGESAGAAGDGDPGGAGQGGAAGQDGDGGSAAGAGGEAGGNTAPLTIVTAKLPAARYAMDYAASLEVGGGAYGDHRFGITSGALPPSIAMSAAGVLSGRPTVEGDYTFEVSVSDLANATAVASFVLAVRRHRWLVYKYEERYADMETSWERLSVLMTDVSRPGSSSVDGGFSFSPDGSFRLAGSTIADVSGSSVGPPIDIAAALVQWSPHSEWLVVQDGAGFSVLRPATPTDLVRFEARTTCSDFRWSPDDVRVAYECDGAVQVFEADASPVPPAAQEVAPGTLIGWAAHDVLTFATSAGKLGYARFGALAAPAKELELTADSLAITATAPALKRAIFRDSSAAKDVLVDFDEERILSEPGLIYSPGLTRFARWQVGGETLSMYSVADPHGSSLIDVPATGFNGWSTEDEVLATSGNPAGQLRFTWLTAPIQTKFLPGASGPATFGPRAEWVFVGSSFAFLNQAEPQLAVVDPYIYGEPAVAPNRERIGYFAPGNACIVNLTAAGLGSPACVPTRGGDFQPPLWSPDSTTFAYRVVGTMDAPNGFPTGLSFIDAENPSNEHVVVDGYAGQTIYHSLGDGFGFQP